MLEEKIVTLEQLTSNSLNVKIEKFINSQLINTERKAYINDEYGISQVRIDLEPQYQTAIFAVWGVTSN